MSRIGPAGMPWDSRMSVACSIVLSASQSSMSTLRSSWFSRRPGISVKRGILDQLRHLEDLIAELCKELLVAAGDDDDAIFTVEAVIGGDRRVPVAHSGRDLAGFQILDGGVLCGGNDRIHQRDIHPLPFSGDRSGVDCGENSDGQMQAAENVPQRAARTGGLAAARTGDRHHAAHRLRENVISRPQVIGAVAAKSTHRGIDNPGVDLFQLVVAQTQPVHHAGAVVLDHDIGPL